MTDRFSLVPRTMTEALDYSKVIADSNFCPKEYRGRPGDVLVAVQYGMELGIMPLQALQGIAIINGKPCIWGDLALAVVRGSGLVEDFDETDPSEAAKGGKAVCTAKRKGQVSPISRSFTIDDAKKAGLWGKAGPWAQYPGRMLVMRARSWTLRDGFADVLKGLQTREEVMDYQDVQATVVPTKTEAPKMIVAKEHPAPLVNRPEDAAKSYFPPARPAITVAVDPNPTEAFPVHEKRGMNHPYPMEREAQEMDPGEQYVVTHREAGDEPPDDGCPADLAAFLKAIADAKSLPQLALVGAEIAQSGMEDGLKADARKAYMAKQAALKAAAK